MPNLSFLKEHELNDISVTFKLSKTRYKELKKWCKKNNVSVSFVIRELVINLLDGTIYTCEKLL